MPVRLLDATLRDGSYCVNFQFTAADTAVLVGMLDEAGVGFIEIGQPAIVKVEAFPFTRYGTIEGKVVKVSRDAVDERGATALTDAATSARPSGSSAGQTGGRPGLVFPVTIELSQRVIHVDSKDIPLSSGMAVTVEVKTGQRRVIEYLLSPLLKSVKESLRER